MGPLLRPAPSLRSAGAAPDADDPIDPKDGIAWLADAYLNCASLLERGGSGGEALALLERARSAGVRDPDVENRIAVFELKRGDVEAAKRALLRSLELRPRDVATLEALARIAERQGNAAEAAAYYERLRSIREIPRSNR